MEITHEGLEGATGDVGHMGIIIRRCEEEFCRHKPNGEA